MGVVPALALLVVVILGTDSEEFRDFRLADASFDRQQWVCMYMHTACVCLGNKKAANIPC